MTSSITTELIFFHLPESVRPEDSSNAEGKQVLEIFQCVKRQGGYLWSAWGRTEEDANALVWVVEWSGDNETASIDDLRRFAKPEPELVKLKTQLTPSLLSVGGITAAPIIDVTTLTFVNDETPEERLKTLATIEMMRSCVTEKSLRALKVPPGKAILHVAVVGWQSTQQHYDVWKTEEFKQIIPKARERFLPWPPGLGIKHIDFRMI